MCTIKELKSVLEDIKSSGKIDADNVKSLTDEERDLLNNLYKEDLIAESLEFLNTIDVDADFSLVKKKLLATSKAPFTRILPFMKYAAIFVAILGLAFFFQTDDKPLSDVKIAEEAIKLKIGEDNIKVIHQNDSQQIVSTNGQILGTQKGNKIIYNHNADINELIYNELEIPNGKIFDIELSDGTVVHLNSGTKIKYPVQFLKGQQREVFIYGEAYFKVAKDKNHPFVVHANDIAIEVLGTEFNISSYDEDSEIKTVLVEGSVSLTNSILPNDKVILKPGYKAAWTKVKHQTTIEKVDVSTYTAWLKGELIFRNSSFENIEKKLERKYNVVIENNNSVLANRILNASFHVDIETIEDVMQTIQEIQPFSYRIDNEKIIID